MAVHDFEVDAFKAVLKRLDAFLRGLLPILKRGDRALSAARKKSLRFVLSETTPRWYGSLYRWQEADDFAQALKGPKSVWHPRIKMPIVTYFDLPEFVPALVSEPASQALLEVAELLLLFVGGDSSPQQQRAAFDELRGAAANYLWHRRLVAQHGRQQHDIAMSKLIDYARMWLKGKQRRVVEIVIEEGGVVKIADLANDKGVDWRPPFSEYNALRFHVNRKLSTLRPAWHLERHDNEVRLERGAVQRVHGKTKRKSK